MGKIPDEKIVSAFRLDETLLTKDDAESLLKELLRPLKENSLEVERGSVNEIMHTLMEKHMRRTGLE